MVYIALSKFRNECGICVFADYSGSAIANGGIVDADNEDTRSGKKMSAEAVGKTYLYLHGQEPALWTHELDLRPAQEKF